jgi:serine/threonine protein kinase/tetratricopeptide (TPR) repeat protein
VIWRNGLAISIQLVDARKSASDLKGKGMKYCPKCKVSYATGQRFCSNDGATLTLQDPYNLLGRALMDKYRLDALVGIGGMGAVYCAAHLSTGRQVAVKILLPNLAIGNPRLLNLFEREARVVGRLRHENIVDIIDAGLTTDGIAYIAMEWLEGRTLDEEIQRNGPLSFQRVSEILRQVAAALQESHSQHIIHRDLKPSNIFLVQWTTGREQVKVVDFGISKSIGDTGGSPVSSVMGTPQYASPEQFRLGENIDSRTDIYSLGVLLFQMLTNALPFNDTTISALIHKHLNEPPPPLRGLRQDIPPALEDLIGRMLAKQPADRPQRVGDIPDLFDKAIDTHRVTTVNEAPIPEAHPGFQHSQAPPTIEPPIETPPQLLMQLPTQPTAQYPIQPPTQPTAPFTTQPSTQPPMRTPAQYPMQPPAQYRMQPPMQPPAQYPMQPPAQYPMQPPMQPPAQYPMQAPMQPPMQPPAQYPMQPPMQYPTLPKPSKRRWGAGSLVIGGAAALFVILVIGVAIALYLSGSNSIWKENMEAERKAFREGRYLEAVNYAQTALKEAEAFGPQDSRLATSLHNAGELYTRLERFDEAERFLQRALSIRKKEDAEAARTICALGRLEQSRGNRDQAERRYRQSLAIRERILGRDHPDVAESLSGLAGVLALKQIGEAEQLARRSLSIREKALGDNHPDVAESLSTLVGVTLDIGKPKEIEAYLRRAIAIRENSLGQAHPDLAQSLIDMGVFLDKRSQCREAEEPIRRAAPILEKAYGANHPVVARGYLALASVIAGQGRISEFEELSDRAVAILEKSSGRESRDVAKALSVKGTALMNLGNYKEAETNLLQSLAILEKSERLMGELVAEAYLNLATLYSKQAAFTKAEDYLQRSTTAYENALGKDNSILSALLIVQAMNLGRLKRSDEAEAKLRQADAGVRRASGTIRAPLASLSALAGALLLLEKGDYEQASQKMGNLVSTLDDSPLLFGDVVHIVYLVSVAQQTKPIVEGVAKVFQARIAGQVPEAQTDNTVQRIELLESTAKRGLTLVEREQCKRNQNLLGEYKTLLAGLYTIKALCIDSAGRHQDAMTVLRDNLPTIQESLKQGGSKSDLYSIFTFYANMLKQTGKNDDAQEIESFVKDVPVGNVSKN